MYIHKNPVRLPEPKIAQKLDRHLLLCLFVAYTWLTPWVLGIAMVRQESWRASIHNNSMLVVKEFGPCLSQPNMSCLGVTLVKLLCLLRKEGDMAVYKWCSDFCIAWQLVCMLQSSAFGPLPDCSADHWTLSQGCISTQQLSPRL